MADLPHLDKLLTGTLRSPMLNQFMVSQALKFELKAILQAVQKGYLSRVPRETSRLASTARISMHHSKIHADRRWYGDFDVGGILGVDYADDVEEEFHPLANTLRALGYATSDMVHGPTGPAARSGPRKSG